MTVEGIEAYALLGQPKSISRMCCFHSMDNVFALIESLGIPLRTVSKRTTKMKNGWTCYTFTTSVPIGNSFLLICSVSSKGSGMNSIWM